MDALSPNAARIVDALFSVVNYQVIVDYSTFSHKVLVREFMAAAEHEIRNRCPHLSAEQKVEVESQIRFYFESTERDELISSIKNWRKKDQQPLVRRLIWCFSFCVFGIPVILMLPISLPLDWYDDWRESRKPIDQKEIHFPRKSIYERLCNVSTALSRSLWPDKPVACYCCAADAGLAKT